MKTIVFQIKSNIDDGSIKCVLVGKLIEVQLTYECGMSGLETEVLGAFGANKTGMAYAIKLACDTAMGVTVDQLELMLENAADGSGV